VFVFPQPTSAFLTDEIYSEKSGYQSNKTDDLNGYAPTKRQKALLSYLGKKIKGESLATPLFLDVGCSNGEIMYLAQKLGFQARGAELNPRTANAARANGLDVFVGTLELAGYPDGIFDVVHIGDVIEHVPDPRALIVEARRVLKTASGETPGGELIIATPNMNCFWAKITLSLWRLFRIPWSSSTPPHHLWQFSADNLKLFLEENGFIVTGAWYNRTPSLKYEIGSLHLLKRWKKRRAASDFLFMAFSFGLYSLVFAVNRIWECLPVKRFDITMTAVKS
jgi:SAM-dependent methyltransferase